MYKKLLVGLFFIFTLCLGNVYAQELVTLQGEVVDAQELMSKGDSVLMLWTTWCPACRRALEKRSVEGGFKDLGVNLYYLNIGENKTTVKKFLDSKNFPQEITDNVILDQGSVIASQYSVLGIPTYLFFRDGEFVHRSNSVSLGLIKDVFSQE